MEERKLKSDNPAVKKVEKIISGEATQKKKSDGQKLLDIILPGDKENIKHYVLFDLIIPYAKKTVLETLEMIFYGETRRKSNSTNGREKPYRSYQKYYEKEEESIRVRKGSYVFDGITFKDRSSAEEALDGMLDILEDQGVVSVGQLYDLVGITSDFTDYNYGWKYISEPMVVRNRDREYEIKLPKPRALT